jgi:hypothetical protein
VTGFTAVTASHVSDTTGRLIADATIWFQPCDTQGRPLSFHTPPRGQVSVQPVSTRVLNGVFTIALADTSLTSPPNVAYAVRVVDNATGNVLLGPKGYLIQPSGDAWDFDQFVPTAAKINRNN